MNPSCLFCNKELRFFNSTDSFNHDKYVVYYCRSHIKYPYIRYVNGELCSVDIDSNIGSYHITMWYEPNSEMFLINYLDRDLEICLPFDPNLTPENFDNKLKTYLIFS